MATVVATAVAPGQAQTVDVTGEWAFAVKTGMGSGSPNISFQQSGETITGTYTGQLGNTDFKRTVKGTDIAFSSRKSSDQNAVTATPWRQSGHSAAGWFSGAG